MDCHDASHAVILPTEGGQAELNWVAGCILKLPHCQLNPNLLIHPNTNRARCRLTLLIR